MFRTVIARGVWVVCFVPFTTGGTPVVPVAGETPATPITGKMPGGPVAPPRRRRSQLGRDKRGPSRDGGRGRPPYRWAFSLHRDSVLPTRRIGSPYTANRVSLHGESGLPTRRVWVSYTAKRRFLRGTSQIAISEVARDQPEGCDCSAP